MTFRNTLHKLKVVFNKYDSASNEAKSILLKDLSTRTIPFNKTLIEYHDLLLFSIAHPSDKELLDLCETELKRLSSVLKKARKQELLKFENSGLPFTKTLSTFSHDLLNWLNRTNQVSITIDSLHKSRISLSDALQFTLPSLEREITAIGYNPLGLFNALKIEKENRLDFLLTEFDRLSEKPYIKDFLFNGLHVYLKLKPKDLSFSKSYNRLKISNHYFHSENLKQFDQVELLNRKLPAEKKLATKEFEETVDIIKNSLTLLQRETDPVTYMDSKSFRLYELERGVSVAIYGMTIDRQLPLESYVGYTLFKNGFPAAYGGGWLFGKRSLFGINIFEPYRGGESGYMMCQLLRVYRQAFGVDYFEVEPYQYGLGNPEGISSGAYWFYYRFGFRSLDKELNDLAGKEFGKIKTNKGYRSSGDTLLRFTESNIALNMGKGIPLTIGVVREKITGLIARHFQGNRSLAEKTVIKKYLEKSGTTGSFSIGQKKVLTEFAFFTEVMKIKDHSDLRLVSEMILLKPKDLYKYQELLLRLIQPGLLPL